MLLGAGGLVGTALQEVRPPDVEVFAFDRARLDLTQRHALIDVVRRLRPDVILNAAAYTAVDRAESEPDAAFAVNAEAVGALGQVAAAHAVRVVHLSTDFVFDGRGAHPYVEHAPTAPLNVYGASKRAGEIALGASGAVSLVVRTQALFGPGGRSFPRTMFERATAGQASRVVTDQIGRPTYTLDLANALWQLVQRGETGVVHAANEGQASWYALAADVYAAVGCPELCTPCTTAEYPTPAIRPPYSCLDTSYLARLLGKSLPHWQDALRRFLNDTLMRQ